QSSAISPQVKNDPFQILIVVHHLKQGAPHVVSSVLGKSGETDITYPIADYSVIRNIFDVHLPFLNGNQFDLVRPITLNAQDDFRTTSTQEYIFDFFVGFAQYLDAIY